MFQNLKHVKIKIDPNEIPALQAGIIPSKKIAKRF